MPRPLTDACAAVLPIVFVAMAFSILSTTPSRLELVAAVQNMTAGQPAFGAGAVLRDQGSKAPDTGNAAAEGNGLTG